MSYARISSLLRNLFRRRRAERDLHEEVGSYVEMLTQENIALGMARVEARRRALIAAGGVEQLKEEVRAVRAGALLEQFWQDVRFGGRMLVKNPGFALVAVLTIALGIGVNAGIFAIVDSATMRPLEVPDSHRVVGIYQLFFGHFRRNVHGSGSMFSYPEYLEYRDHNHVFSGLTAFQPFVEATVSGYPQQLTGSLTTCNYFDVLRAPIALGRGFLPSECAAEGSGPVVVLSDGLWRGAFGADPHIVGKIVRLNRQPLTVVGVAGSGFHGTEVIADDFWVPVVMQQLVARAGPEEGDLFHQQDMSWLVMLGRLRDGISVRRAQSDLEVIAGQIDQRYSGRTTRLLVMVATYFTEPEMSKISTAVSTIVLIAVGMVLLIACANVANLMLARAVKRRREIAVRLAIGAARGRLVRQMLTESLLLAAIGGGLGLLIAVWSSGAALRLMLASLPPGAPPFVLHVQPDARLFLYALGLTVATAVVFGLAPALQATRGDVNADLKVETTSWMGGGRGRMRSLLITAQVAVCMALLISAGLLLRGLYRAQTLDTGFDHNHTALASFDLRGAGYDAARAAAFHREARARLRSLAGVDAVASALLTPLNGSRDQEQFRIEGEKDSRQMDFNAVSREYFAIVGIPMVRGRTFLETEKSGQAAIVSEAGARRLWPGQDALGKRIRVEDGKTAEGTWMVVVGIARDADTVKPGDRSANLPVIYLPLSPAEELRAGMLVHSKTGYAAIAPAIPIVLHQLDADLLVRVAKLEDNLQVFVAPSQIAAGLAATLGGLALLLAAIGIYGTVSYNVGRRTREIGIRMTLGARAGDIQSLVLRQAMRPVVAGAAIGSALCAAVSSVLAVLLFGVSPLDPLAFASVAAFLLLVAAAASYLPTRRAVRVDPMVALRQE